MVLENFFKFKGNEQVMRQSICTVSNFLEDYVRVNNPAKYWEMMRSTYVDLNGRHFDKVFGEWQVKRMHHKGDDGHRYEGEHWSFEQTNAVMAKYRSRINAAYTEWDFYVALNATYHDFCAWAKKRNPENYESDIIEMALAFWFMDDDWNSATKVWDYFSLLKE